jgi:hypothetical protein
MKQAYVPADESHAPNTVVNEVLIYDASVISNYERRVRRFNRTECQESSRGKGRPARKADNLTAICDPIVYKLW